MAVAYSDYEKERQRQTLKSRRSTALASEVKIPACTNPDLVAATRHDLHLFLRECFPNSTGLRPFGDGQQQAIGHIEHCILKGGRVAQAFPRGFAKTAIAVRAGIWGVLHGHRKFIPIFCASEPNADAILDSIKTELAENDILHGMFPWLECIRALEGKPQRCPSQHVGGILTNISWRADRIVLPSVDKCPFSGSIILSKSMRSARGLQHTTDDGTVIRPDFVIMDDIQTDEDANSPAGVRKLTTKVKKSILRGGGHSASLAAIMNCTVICPEDAAEAFLNDPGWQSVRYKMVPTMPDNMDLWTGPYRDILIDFDRNDPKGQRTAARKAMDYYQANRYAMDQGAVVAWEWAYAWDDDEPVECSALQHAMNILLLEGEEVFASECQNEPIRIDDTLKLSPKDIIAKGTRVSDVPQETQHLVAHIDVQQDCLFFCVGGFGLDYTGGVVQFGAFPEQRKPYFNLADLKIKLSDVFPGETIESAIYKGLETLVDTLVNHNWKREDGLRVSLSRILIDSAYKTSTVELFCRNTRHHNVVMPARGVYVGARHQRLTDKPWNPKPGEARGDEWEIRKTVDGSSLRVVYDTNHWKSFVWDRFADGIGTAGSWRVAHMDPKRLEMLADQVTAEFPTEVTGNGRKVQEWQLKPTRRDNHGFDNCVGLAVAANMLGCRLPDSGADIIQRKRTVKRIKFSDVRR